MVRHVVGCMTGTSIDGLDVALVRIEGSRLSMIAKFVAGRSVSLGGLAQPLRALAEQQPQTAGEIARVSRDFALAHVEAIAALLQDQRFEPDLVAVHGQTVFHSPPVSWQLFNPTPIARAFGAPVVFDLRAADLAAGGQGAPITPLADHLLFAEALEHRAVVNLGGFCNITLLPPRGAVESASPIDIQGFDLCSCNHLLNAIARKLLNSDFDVDGREAAQGTILADPLEDLLGVLASQAGQRKGTSMRARSLGTGDEAMEWVSRYRAHHAPRDIAATACEALGQSIARAISERRPETARILLAGGGARNRTLVAAISGWASSRVATVGDFGVPIEYREAAAMAVLGALCQDDVPITLPQVTGVGVPAPIAGCWAGPPRSRQGPSR